MNTIPIPLPLSESPAACHRYIRANGINISELCRQAGIPREVAVDLLRGKRKGLRGQAHRAAILLGLKPDPATLKLAA